jgi:hypothetical protein
MIYLSDKYTNDWTNQPNRRGAFFKIKKILNGAMARQLAVSLWQVGPALAAPNECVCGTR